jgi:uracil-xanthine permease
VAGESAFKRVFGAARTSNVVVPVWYMTCLDTSADRPKSPQGGAMDALGHTKVGKELAGDGASGPQEMLTLRYRLEDRLPPLPAVFYGLQHVLIMFAAMVASPLVIGQLLDLSAELRATLVTAVILGCGLGTVISALGVSFIGARLPLLLGAYAVYIGPVVAIAKAQSLGAAAGAMLMGGVLLLAISPVIGKLRPLFPPVVVGTLLVVTSLSLMKIATNVAFAANTPYFGKPITIVFLLASIALIAAIATLGNELAKSLSVLITLAVVYAAGMGMGLGRLDAIASAPWFRIPGFLPYGIAWPDAGSLTTVLIYHVVAAIYTMSITMALCVMIGVEPSERRIRGAVAGDGLGSLLAVLFGGVSLISYDQNVGAISLTGVASRFVIAVAGGILILMAFVPKLAAVISVIPPFLLGGTLLFMFGMIAAVGIRILSQAMSGQREILLVAISVGLGTIVNFAPAPVFEVFPSALKILAADGIIVGTLAAVILNLALPNRGKASGGNAA